MVKVVLSYPQNQQMVTIKIPQYLYGCILVIVVLHVHLCTWYSNYIMHFHHIHPSRNK